MDLINYLDIVRRRWLLLLTTLAITLLATWVTLPDATQASSPTMAYRATATLVASPTSSTPPNLATVALFAKVGEVPERAADRLDYDGEPQALAATVATGVATETSTLTITSTGTNAVSVARTANVFASELVAHFERQAQQQAKAQLDDLSSSLNGYATRIRELDRRLAKDSGNTQLRAERDGLQTHYQTVIAQMAQINDQASRSQSPIEILQEAVSIAESTTSFTPASSPGDRFMVGGAVGLALGLALVLIIERLDSRLRTREEVETAFQLPVLAEIPTLPWRQRRERSILSASDPGSATAEAYRALRSAVLLLRANPEKARHDVGQHPAVILVTSARPDEGKSSTVANLAVAMAESGRRVLVLSLDFRNPQVHDYFGVPSGAGLSDLLSANRTEALPDVIRETQFPGVRLATSGQETSFPGALLAGAGPLIHQARQLADVVLIDSAPLLTVSDAVDLSPHVDAALVVSRAKGTTTGQARAVHRLLSRLGVPALGAVLIGGSESKSYGGYPTRGAFSQQVANFVGASGRRHRHDETTRRNRHSAVNSSKDGTS